MALKGNLSAELSYVGYEFPESYARIIWARVEKEETVIWVNFYANEAARLAEKTPVKQAEYRVPTAALTGEALPASYAWLKGQPDFSGWNDI